MISNKNVKFGEERLAAAQKIQPYLNLDSSDHSTNDPWPIGHRSGPVAQWLEHCVSSAKAVGSIPREHILTKKSV